MVLVDESGSALRTRLRKPLVVCVDDSRETLCSLRRLLGTMPCRVWTTDRPREALDWIAGGDVNVVISDQRMPGMSGTDLLRQVRDLSPATARMLLTASADDADVRREVGEAVQAVIEKPWDGAALRREIVALLHTRETGGEA